jgi:uncharacterized protein
LVAKISFWWEKCSFSAIGSLFLSSLFPFSLSRLILMGFFPEKKLQYKEFVNSKILPKVDHDIQIPYDMEKSASLLANTLKDIGAYKQFAPFVLVVGHCSTSLNNPFSSAYNCGACGGRGGGPNARLFSKMANNKTIRGILLNSYNINIPDDTVFIGAMHNTTAETIEYYDLDILDTHFSNKFVEVRNYIETVLKKNALERCNRFMLAQNIKTPEEAIRHVKIRANDIAEIRPELNHATNAAIIIGRREISKGLFLDRRVFLPSYDPFGDDERGTNLEHIIAPALVVFFLL